MEPHELEDEHSAAQPAGDIADDTAAEEPSADLAAVIESLDEEPAEDAEPVVDPEVPATVEARREPEAEPAEDTEAVPEPAQEPEPAAPLPDATADETADETATVEAADETADETATVEAADETADETATVEAAVSEPMTELGAADTALPDLAAARQGPAVPWWPYVIYLAAWVGLVAVTMLTIAYESGAQPAYQQQPYPYIIIAGLALAVLGPVLSLVVWLTVWARAPKGERGGLLTSALVKGAGVTFFGSLAWYATIVAVDALRLGLIG